MGVQKCVSTSHGKATRKPRDLRLASILPVDTDPRIWEARRVSARRAVPIVGVEHHRGSKEFGWVPAPLGPVHTAVDLLRTTLDVRSA